MSDDGDGFVRVFLLLWFFLWLVALVVALAHQSTPAAICFAALTYGMTHWESNSK